MNIIVNGCSFTNWWSAGKLAQRSWAYQQDDTFSKSSYTNLGKKASSNGEIILNTIEELKTSGYVGNAVRTGPSFDKNEKTIIILQLSGLDRLYINKQRSPHVKSILKNSKLFNWWGMPTGDGEQLSFWENYFKNDYSEENHFNLLLNNLLEFQKFIDTLDNVDYRIFCGWDIFTQHKDSENPKFNMWDFKTKYENIEKPLVKDAYKSSKELFNQLDLDKFWFFENSKIKYGGMMQWIQYNLDVKDWYNDIKSSPPDFHPTELGHKKFYDEVIEPMIKEMIGK